MVVIVYVWVVFLYQLIQILMALGGDLGSFLLLTIVIVDFVGLGVGVLVWVVIPVLDGLILFSGFGIGTIHVSIGFLRFVVIICILMVVTVCVVSIELGVGLHGFGLVLELEFHFIIIRIFAFV